MKHKNGIAFSALALTVANEVEQALTPQVKHRNALLVWAKSWHYPYLSLSDGSHIAHGLASWRQASRNPKRTMLAWQRIHMWEARASEERTAS